jgi:hypothetical protein
MVFLPRVFFEIRGHNGEPDKDESEITSSWPGLSRLRGRSPFGAAEARPSTSLGAAGKEDVDARDKPGHDEGGEGRALARD